MAGFVAVAILGSCTSESNWRNVEGSIEEWTLPPSKYEYVVSPAIPHEELTSTVDSWAEDGWEVVSVEPAGRDLPGRHILVFRRPRS